MADTDKIFRDPLYNYVAVDKGRDKWLLDLIDTPEVQRLRRIRQLGVSDITYPGADHSRLCHTLGVLHLMQQAWHRVEMLEEGPAVERARHVLLAAAVLHDVGHGPFSHLFEPSLGTQHEDWSCEVLRSADTAVRQKLDEHDIPADQVAALIQKNNRARPPWPKTLLSSELDVDRLDYLRRDSYFTGSGYGHFDCIASSTHSRCKRTTMGSKFLCGRRRRCMRSRSTSLHASTCTTTCTNTRRPGDLRSLLTRRGDARKISRRAAVTLIS
ncbi:MAG: HD domain-containing protein [Planctomycetia bacterium]|nr:HD domain-containing protein [Planctomycetia bacterium]